MGAPGSSPNRPPCFDQFRISLHSQINIFLWSYRPSQSFQQIPVSVITLYRSIDYIFGISSWILDAIVFGWLQLNRDCLESLWWLYIKRWPRINSILKAVMYPTPSIPSTTLDDSRISRGEFDSRKLHIWHLLWTAMIDPKTSDPDEWDYGKRKDSREYLTNSKARIKIRYHENAALVKKFGLIFFLYRPDNKPTHAYILSCS